MAVHMRERWQWSVMAVVVTAHVLATWWLARAMQQLPTRVPASVLMVEFFDAPTPAAEPEPTREDQPVPDPALRRDQTTGPPSRVLPPVRRPVRPPREPSTMEAVIVPAEPAPPAPATGRVAPERDPFHRPSDAAPRGFGRRDIAGLPAPTRPRLPGEAAPDAPLQGLRHGRLGPREVVDKVAALIGGGRNAPVEAPCGNRLSGGFGTADSFSPNWQQQYGCGDEKQRAGFDGTVELPPGVAGAGE